MKHSIQDSQVDLCGELGHEEEDDFPPLALGDTFSFSCRGCGGCCKDRQDIVLSGYDLYRLCARLQLPPELVLNAFCRVYTGKVSLLPVARLQPREESGNNCPFLFNNRCSVHEAKPLVCALYPLGQTIELNGSITYFCQDSSCGGPRMEFTLQDYLDSFSIRQREAPGPGMGPAEHPPFQAGKKSRPPCAAHPLKNCPAENSPRPLSGL